MEADHVSATLTGGIAVITGAAGEIGRAMARSFARNGMTVVLSDVDAQALAAADDEVSALGGDATAVVADVSDPRQIAHLCTTVLETLGTPSVVCANAGVMGPFADMWSQHYADWSWLFGVNVFGVLGLVHGLLPAMIGAPTRSHFVITGSDATYAARPYVAVYHATKHALGAIAEGLAMELSLANAPVSVHLVCPTGVNAPRLLADDRERLRPTELRIDDTTPHPMGDRLLNAYRSYKEKQSGDDVAAALLKGIQEDRFYVWPDPNIHEMIKEAYEGTLGGHSPRLPEEFMRIFTEQPYVSKPTDSRIGAKR
jgi:NAD(P)-dependent dehydrogenase (short-subunit alcohol dehydrogenase family)